jgi:hypothetical protein
MTLIRLSLNVLGDGGRPVCQMCTKRHVPCERPTAERKFVVYTATSASSQLAQQVGDIDSLQTADQPAVVQQNSTRQPVSCDERIWFRIPEPASPAEDLHNGIISGLFHHYVEHLASWYDLCEHNRPFESLVPSRALEVPIVFNAVIAFAAQHKALDDSRFEHCSTSYHSACISGLLSGIPEFNSTLQEDYLVAACLLRSYEILKGRRS